MNVLLQAQVGFYVNFVFGITVIVNNQKFKQQRKYKHNKKVNNLNIKQNT